MIVKTKRFKINVELADNIFKQIKGLMFSKKKNMLFRFPSNKRWEFWMFGLRYPIDIIFINDGKISEIQRAVPMKFLDFKTWKIYKPKKPCHLVLESYHLNKFKVGDKLIIR